MSLRNEHCSKEKEKGRGVGTQVWFSLPIQSRPVWDFVGPYWARSSLSIQSRPVEILWAHPGLKTIIGNDRPQFRGTK